MLLQLELKEFLGENLPEKSFAGFNEAVLAEEYPGIHQPTPSGHMGRPHHSSVTKKAL